MKKICGLLLSVLLLSGCTAPKADKGQFVDFLQRTRFPMLIHQTFASPQDIPPLDALRWFMPELLTFARIYYDDTAGIESKRQEWGTRYFTSEELEPVSQDLLGYSYELLSGREKNDPYTNRVAETIYQEGEGDEKGGFYFTVDEASFGQDGDILSIEADLSFYDGKEELYWRMGYTFQYMPDNEYIPYRLLSSTVLQGRAPGMAEAV